MKRAVLLGAVAVLTLAACTQVKPGHVGIKINQYGSGAGVEPNAYGVGTYFVPIGSSMVEYPTFTQTYTYTRAENEGKSGGGNEEFNFQDKNGLGLTADIGVSYSVDHGKAPALYSKFRSTAEGLVATQIRNEIRNALNDRAAQMGVEEIYGPKKAQLLNEVQTDTATYFKPYGLNVERLFWAGNIRVPDSVLAQINAKIANEQAALAAVAKVATAKAESDQMIATAQGKAEALKIEGDALRSNPETVQLRAIEKWDGQLPTYASSGPLPFIGNAMNGNK